MLSCPSTFPQTQGISTLASQLTVKIYMSNRTLRFELCDESWHDAFPLFPSTPQPTAPLPQCAFLSPVLVTLHLSKGPSAHTSHRSTWGLSEAAVEGHFEIWAVGRKLSFSPSTAFINISTRERKMSPLLFSREKKDKRRRVSLFWMSHVQLHPKHSESIS